MSVPLWITLAEPPISDAAFALWCAAQYAEANALDASMFDLANWAGVEYGLINTAVKELWAAEDRWPPCLRCRVRRRYGRSLSCRDCLRQIERFRQNSAYKARARAMLRGAVCAWCGTPDRLTVDHINPLARGGSNDADNLQVLCHSCNSLKGARPPAWRPQTAAAYEAEEELFLELISMFPETHDNPELMRILADEPRERGSVMAGWYYREIDQGRTQQ